MMTMTEKAKLVAKSVPSARVFRMIVLQQDVHSGLWSVLSIYEANNFAYLYRIGASETRYATRNGNRKTLFYIGETA